MNRDGLLVGLAWCAEHASGARAALSGEGTQAMSDHFATDRERELEARRREREGAALPPEYCCEVKPPEEGSMYREMCGLMKGHAGRHAGPASSWPAEKQVQPPAALQEQRERNAWEAGFKLALSYGDNHHHFDGEQKERQWKAYYNRVRSPNASGS